MVLQPIESMEDCFPRSPNLQFQILDHPLRALPVTKVECSSVRQPISNQALIEDKKEEDHRLGSIDRSESLTYEAPTKVVKRKPNAIKDVSNYLMKISVQLQEGQSDRLSPDFLQRLDRFRIANGLF